MFIEQQEREREEAENRRASRKIKQATSSASSGVALSGLMSNLESGGADGLAAAAAKHRHVGEDDDDSIGDQDDWSLDSEDSFYVGIERADYAQPNNLEMYGEENKDDEDEDWFTKEDRFGISRVSVSIINRENNSKLGLGSGNKAAVVLDWDADIPIHEEGRSSLHEFMNGTSAGGNNRGLKGKKDKFVARPVVAASLAWREEGKLGDGDDAAIDQVYEHEAAEGKMFIDKIVNETGKDGEGATVGGLVSASSRGIKSSGGARGNYPVISPMALFSPGITTGSKVVEGEDNGVRQMRERELRKDASAEGIQKMKDVKKLLASKKDKSGKVDAYEMMKLLEKMMEM